MIIDDDPEMIENVTAVLGYDDVKIESHDAVTGAVEAIEKAEPDLLILDVMFPENPAGGFDVARAVRNVERLKTLPIILLTAINQEFPMDWSSEDIDEEWMPVQKLMEKPVKLAELRSAVDELLGR
jgi:CheY-like chemotaxis protein